MLAAEWGRYNINVNCLSPSYVLTPMHASTPVVVRQRIRELTPLGHVQRPEDLYGAVIFLASAASNYVTGHDLMVDGGHTLNAWLTPLSRAVPPRVSPEEETVQLKHDLEVARPALRRRRHQPDRPPRNRRRLQGGVRRVECNVGPHGCRTASRRRTTLTA